MDLKLPPLGEGADSGNVVSILVKVGDAIAKGQGIIELETGKAVAPVPASAAGKVTKIIVAVGDKISVGQPILSIEAATAAPAAKPARGQAAGPPSAAARAAAPPPPPARRRLNRRQRKRRPPAGRNRRLRLRSAGMARELGINSEESSRQRRGRTDRHGGCARLHRAAATTGRPTPRRGAAGAPAQPPPGAVDYSKWGPIARRPLTPLRKVIAERMAQSWNTVPRVTQFDEADITALDGLRKKHAAAYEAKGARLTLTSFALTIVAAALKKHPIFNSSLDEAAGELVWKEYFHIGLAVDTEQGLIVPVVRDVDKKNILSLSKELGELAAKTRDRKVSLEELQGGSFTISNQGGIGGGHFTPIVNLPEVAILGLGRGALKPVVREGKIEPRLMLPLALSYDHRVIDGGAAVRFMLEIVKGFEKFEEAGME